MATWSGTKAINLSQLAAELGGAPLRMTGNWPDGQQKTITADTITQTALDNAVAAHVADFSGLVRRRPRKIYDIYQDVKALTTTNQNLIWTDITSGTPPKWAADAGPNAAAIAAIHWSAANSGAAAAAITDARQRLVAMYCQDNFGYLVNPSFAPSINVPGDEVSP